MSASSTSAVWGPKGVVAVLDTATLVRAWLSREDDPNPARNVMRLAGQAYDSFTSPAILEEVEDVLVRPRFGASRGQVRLWLDAFLRVSRQVFPEIIPGGDPAVVGGDPDDLPVLNTAYAAAGGGAENTRDFSPGRNVYGWRFVTAYTFLRVLRRRGRSPA